jgi:hypothetical protein
MRMIFPKWYYHALLELILINSVSFKQCGRTNFSLNLRGKHGRKSK